MFMNMFQNSIKNNKLHWNSQYKQNYQNYEYVKMSNNDKKVQPITHNINRNINVYEYFSNYD